MWLLRILLTEGRLIGWAAAHLSPDWIRHPGVRVVVQHLYAQGLPEAGVAALLEELPDPAAAGLVTEVAADGRAVPNPGQQLPDIATKLRNAFLENQLAALIREMEQPATSEERRIELLRSQQALRTLRRQPLPPVEQ
jgi:hypothetical protein